MKSFKQYLEESWKKYRDRERKRRGEYVNPVTGNKLRDDTNKRERRLYRAMGAHADYEDHRNPQQREKEYNDISDRLEQFEKNDQMRMIYRAAKMLGYNPGPGFGHLLYMMRNQVSDEGLSRDQFIRPLQQHFETQSRIRAAANKPISDERRAKEKESFENLLMKYHHPETAKKHKELIGRHLERNKTRMRKLGIKI